MARLGRSVALALGILATAVVSVPAGAQQCAGDCDGDHVVGVDELVLCIDRALGDSAVGCDTCDPDRSGIVTVDELISAVGSALGIVLQGVCRVPCQGAECELSEAAANGLVPCAEGTAVEVARCDDRTICLQADSGRALIGTGRVESGGDFSVRIDACQSVESLFIVEAVVDEQSAVSYRTLFGSAADTTLSAPEHLLSFLGDLLLDPSTEAAVQLLDPIGLENFTAAGALGVLDAVRTANQDTQFANQDPSAAANALAVAGEDPAVEEAVMQGKLPTPTPTETPTPIPPTATPSATSTPTTPLVGSVEIHVESVTGRPGETVQLDVRLNIVNAAVVATDNVLTFPDDVDAAHCESSLDAGGLAQFVYEPQGCEEDPFVACSSVRGLFFSHNFNPVEDGTVLYSCAISISGTAPPQSHPIVCSDALASNPEGQPFNGAGRCRESISTPCDDAEDCAAFGGGCRILPPTNCENASLTVLEDSTVTPTPTEDPPTPTPTPSTGTKDGLAAAMA